jgi:imidazolonepropionase-like amidohydrolase
MPEHRVFLRGMKIPRLAGLLCACLAAACAQASDLVLTHIRVYTAPDTAPLEDATDGGEIRGPRILTTGEPFFPPNGVRSYVKGYLEQNGVSLPDDPSTAAALQRLRREVHEGVDGIKIFAGSIEGGDVLPMPLERAQAIAAEAHRLGRPVFAHPSNLAGVELAVDSGVDVLAHVTSDDQPWSAELIERMRTAHMALVPTLSLFHVEAIKAGDSVEQEHTIVDRAVARLRAYVAAGGEILFGTDVGYIYQFDTAEEYTLMARAGMSFSQILASLTTNPARRFGFADHSGRLAQNMHADFTVLWGDPATELAALADVRYTIRAGKIIFRALPSPDRTYGRGPAPTSAVPQASAAL